jgi:hypothetical protein
MTQNWLPPNIKPFKRLQVTDGMLMNAERWKLAHDYHKLRQNIHFQSLNQPGIVCDLGVRIIPPPTDVLEKYRDQRWVQIQPGIAIDVFGNFIVIPEPINFRITSQILSDEILTVYLVVSYVDPDKLQPYKEDEIVTETFRINERVSPPNDWEVEVCRFYLQGNPIILSSPKNVFEPSLNQLDLRYRPQAKSRPQAIVRLAIMPQSLDSSSTIVANLTYLLKSVAGLYPSLQVSEQIESAGLSSIGNCEIIYLVYHQISQLNSQELEVLKNQLIIGATLLIEVPIAQTKLEELMSLQQQLKSALSELVADEEILELQTQLQTELTQIEIDLQQEVEQLLSGLKNFANLLNYPLEGSGEITLHHPLRNRPFLFAQFPRSNQIPIQVLNWGGIILVIGNLSDMWGLDATMSRERETIRTAQELGINVLEFACRRKQMIQLQGGVSSPSNI